MLHFPFDVQGTRVSHNELVEVAMHVVLPQEVVVAEVEQVSIHIPIQLCGQNGRWRKLKMLVMHSQANHGKCLHQRDLFKQTTGTQAAVAIVVVVVVFAVVNLF